MGQGTTDGGRPKGPMPMSPHVQIWRWHITMAASILTRATGVALYGALLIAAIWAVCLASGPDAYDGFTLFMGSWFGQLVLFGISVSIFYHLAAGLRHLAFDSGHGFEPKTANMTAAICMAFAVAATLVVWAIWFLVAASGY